MFVRVVGEPPRVEHVLGCVDDPAVRKVIEKGADAMARGDFAATFEAADELGRAHHKGE